MSAKACFVSIALLAACGSVNKESGDDDDDTPGLPSSCEEAGASAADKNVQLYLDGDSSKPFLAHCTAELGTFIPLEGSNISSYPIGGCGMLGADADAGVITTWQMVYFDTDTHRVDTGDYSFATSTGTTHEDSGDGAFVHDFDDVPFGSGRSCANGTAQMVATIDLTGTHFAIASAQTWSADGFTATTDAAINPQRTKATITATGFPVGTSPCALNTDYYTVMGGNCLQLDYVP